jgi:hypothetical protein
LVTDEGTPGGPLISLRNRTSFLETLERGVVWEIKVPFGIPDLPVSNFVFPIKTISGCQYSCLRADRPQLKCRWLLYSCVVSRLLLIAIQLIFTVTGLQRCVVSASHNALHTGHCPAGMSPLSGRTPNDERGKLSP